MMPSLARSGGGGRRSLGRSRGRSGCQGLFAALGDEVVEKFTLLLALLDELLLKQGLELLGIALRAEQALFLPARHLTQNLPLGVGELDGRGLLRGGLLGARLGGLGCLGLGVGLGL